MGLEGLVGLVSLVGLVGTRDKQNAKRLGLKTFPSRLNITDPFKHLQRHNV